MIKELKYVFYFFVIFFFFFFTLKYYFSDDNKKNSYRSIQLLDSKIDKYTSDLIILKNEDGKEFTVKQIVKTAMFGGKGSSGEPSGADWEDIITHHYNLLIGQPGYDSNATKAVEEKWDDFDIIGEKIAQNFIKEIGKSGMTQYGAGKSKSNLSYVQVWQRGGTLTIEKS